METYFTPQNIKMMRDNLVNDGTTADYVDAKDFLATLDEVEILQKSLCALQEATRWIPVGERFPDINDCPNEKEPYVIARINGRLYGLVRITEFTGYPYDEWKRIDISTLPLPVPPEGGE